MHPFQPLNAQQFNKQEEHELNRGRKLKDFICPCGKSYGSYPALFAHIKGKHNGIAPGQVIRPNTNRRRGRPYKYQPMRFQNQNSHKNASKHLSYYLGSLRAHSNIRNIRDQQQINKFPLRQIALRQKQYFQISRLMRQQQQRLLQRQKRNNLFQNHQKMQLNQQINQNQSQNYPFNQKRYPLNEKNYSFNQKDYPLLSNLPQNIDSQKMPLSHLIPSLIDPMSHQNMQSPYFRYNNNNEDLQMGEYNFMQRDMMHQSDPRVFQFIRGEEADYMSMLYEKPFQRALNQQMQVKFRPIQVGLMEFLESILADILNIRQTKQNAAQIHKQNSKQIISIEDSQHQNQEENNNQGYITNSSISQRYQKKFTIQKLIRNYHLNDILKWLMSPPQQINHIRKLKQNYIQFSFRCSIVQFLDFLNNFLQKPQYQQILVLLIFFCDHILSSTGSFQLRPQPQIYEMSSFFNDFIDQYIPRLISSMNQLQMFFIFIDYRRKISQLFMWWSSWISIQQYYHNKYFRLTIEYEIQQQNYKALVYHQNYQKYIQQAMIQNKKPEIQTLPQQKQEDNAQMNVIISNKQQSQNESPSSSSEGSNQHQIVQNMNQIQMQRQGMPNKINQQLLQIQQLKDINKLDQIANE